MKLFYVMVMVFLLQFLAGIMCLWSVYLWFAAWTFHLQVCLVI